MRYVVLLNGKYMNTYKNYSDAVEVRDRLENKFPKATIEIITSEEFEGRYK